MEGELTCDGVTIPRRITAGWLLISYEIDRAVYR
jgi:hypothetical protein